MTAFEENHEFCGSSMACIACKMPQLKNFLRVAAVCLELAVITESLQVFTVLPNNVEKRETSRKVVKSV